MLCVGGMVGGPTKRVAVAHLGAPAPDEVHLVLGLVGHARVPRTDQVDVLFDAFGLDRVEDDRVHILAARQHLTEARLDLRVHLAALLGAVDEVSEGAGLATSTLLVGRGGLVPCDRSSAQRPEALSRAAADVRRTTGGGGGQRTGFPLLLRLRKLLPELPLPAVESLVLLRFDVAEGGRVLALGERRRERPAGGGAGRGGADGALGQHLVVVGLGWWWWNEGKLDPE